MPSYKAFGSKKKQSLDDRIRQYFTNLRHSSAYAGATTVWAEFNKSREKTGLKPVSIARVKKALSQKQAYVFHKLPRKPKQFLRSLAVSKNEIWSADLVSWETYKKDVDRNPPFTLNCVDV